MRASVEATHHGRVMGGIGGFGGIVPVPAGMREPLLVSSTDGVGTKTAIAGALNRFDTIGVDLVAMCADDVVCSGAAPLFFLDYIAVGRLIPEQIAELEGSIARGCDAAGAALVGGETAEHPGLMGPDAFDLAGCCVGVVEREHLIDGSQVRAGDAIVGLASSGLHANGFSLVRVLLEEHDLELSTPYAEVLGRVLGRAEWPRLAAEPEHGFATVGEVLLTPTRIYARRIIETRERLQRRGADLHAIAHITGGGLPGNVARVLPDGLGAWLDPAAWPVPSVMRLFAALGGLDDAELRATFNAGIGMVLVVAPDEADRLAAEWIADGVPAWVIGEVRPEAALAGARYVEAALAR